MASTWGVSWGVAWGNSWGAIASAVSLITSSGRVSAGTAWNKNWAIDYGPDAERARLARKREVQRALTALKSAPPIPEIAPVQAMARRSLAAEMMSDEANKTVLMLAYYEYVRWKKEQRDDDERAAEILLLL